MTVFDERPMVSLELDSRPETLTLVRGALGGVGELLSFDPELLDDLKTAVSEACNNVVMHAYDDDPGPMDVHMYAEQDAIAVVVDDRGGGLPLMTSSDDQPQGVGLPVIHALASSAEFRTRPGGGTEVRMEFAGRRDGRALFEAPGRPGPVNEWADHLAGDAVVSVSPVSLLSGVLGRIARALAAQARFSLDRFSDVYLVTDGISAHAATAAAGSRVGFGISTHERRLELMIGPFLPGATAQLCAQQPSGHIGSALTLLSDELEINPIDNYEMLRLVMVDRRQAIPRAPI
jgi:serine/threonine-protein kinase RsbW